ncbi:hypothetical protein [Tsukamurella sp. 1534]|uniref:hypothetical protein n=1 Tax=Tsukamurella sp. 1534 TaxID=1151061 RepID=UPI00030C14AC|nr:hypothetical protein [Tsukamurella sp. 1534]
MTRPPNNPGDNPQDNPQPGQPGQPQPPQGGVPPQVPPPQAGQGFPPPPPGGYPPPGGFPPPEQPYPPQGYGQPGYGQPGYAQPGYSLPPQAHFNLGDAFSWAWNKFTKNAAALIVPILVYGIITLAVMFLGVYLVGSFGVDGSSIDADGTRTVSLTTGGSISSALLALLVSIIGYLALASYVTGLLDIADGKQVGIGSFFAPRNAGQAVVGALLLALIQGLLALIPYVGGIASIVVGLLTMFVIPTIVDRNVSVGEGFKQGFAVFQKDAGNSILVYIIAGLLFIVGAAICLVGALVAVPVAALVMINAYRLISGGQVAAPTP